MQRQRVGGLAIAGMLALGVTGCAHQQPVSDGYIEHFSYNDAATESQATFAPDRHSAGPAAVERPKSNLLPTEPMQAEPVPPRSAAKSPIQPALQSPLNFADFADAGTFTSPADGYFVGGVNAEQATAEAFDRGEARDFVIQRVAENSREQLLLATRYGLLQGPAQDERLLLLYRQTGGPMAQQIPKGMWRVVRAGRQWRCIASAMWDKKDC